MKISFLSKFVVNLRQIKSPFTHSPSSTHTMKTSLIITTYNSPSYLTLTLKSVLNQTVMPDEVIIADDGSGDETRELIDSFRKIFPVKLVHVWHPDEGFRLAAIRNKAIAKASGEYIIQIDGDIILHPEFIADHLKYATKGCFVGASRTFVKQNYSEKMLRSGQFDYAKLKENSKNKLNSIRIPMLTSLLKYQRSHDKLTIRGCNMAYWKEDAIKINGYNEAFKGWGSEDCDFSVRLSNLGRKKLWLKFSAIEYHTFHPENSREQKSTNLSMVEDALSRHLTYVTDGIVKEKPDERQTS